MDVLLLAERDEVVVLQQEGVALDLVGGGNNPGGIDDSLEVLNGEVGDTDSSGLGLGQLQHGYITSAAGRYLLCRHVETFPSVHNGDTIVDGNIAVREILSLLHGEKTVARREGHRPVDQVQLRRQRQMACPGKPVCERIRTST